MKVNYLDKVAVKKERNKLLTIETTIKMLWSFKKIKSYKDLLSSVGYKEPALSNTWSQSELNRLVTFDDIKEYISDKKIELETAIWLANHPPKNEFDYYEREERGKDAAFKAAISDTKPSMVVDTDSKIERRTISSVTTTPPQPEDGDYGFDKWKVKLPDNTIEAFLYWHQKKSVAEILDNFVNKNHRAAALIAAAGLGKTFVLGAIIKIAKTLELHKKNGSVSPWPFVYVTKASIVEQTKRVLLQFFGLRSPRDILVINIEKFRSKAGELFLSEELIVSSGAEYTKWVWRDHLHPWCIIWDECQVLKNTSSTQHQIGAAFNDIKDAHTIQIFSSATPWTRVCEAKCFAVATRHIQSHTGVVDTLITNDNWNQYAKVIASPADPLEHSPAAIDRLMNDLDPYIIRVKNVHPQFKANNQVLMIDFETEEDAKFYDTAVDRFYQKKQKALSKFNSGTITAGQYNMIKLVAMLQYRIAAESNPGRIRHICRDMYTNVTNKNRAAVCAFNFVISTVKAIEELVYTYKVPRDKISVIWGGVMRDPSEKEKAKAAIDENDELRAALEAAGISLESLSLDDVDGKAEPIKLDPALKLGPQSMAQRQEEIDKFQSGRSLYCFYTLKSGGVGLSLHHTDERTKQKCRRKKSGYAYEEDIPLIPTRQRITYCAPTWSAIELVQGLGRVPRLTSLSTTDQYLIFFRGTIEERVARIVGMKLRCLTKVVRQRESWEDVITGDYTDDEIESKHMKEEDADTEEVFASDSESDEV